MGCIQAKEAMVERTRSLRNPPPDLSEEENRVMPAADSAQRAPTVKPSTPASPAAAADSSSSGSKSPSKSPSKPATASAKPAVTFQVEPTEVPLHMDDDEDDADPAVAPTPESPDKSKRTQSWRSASKKSSSKSVSYDGDKAEDSKMADMKTSLALKAKRRGDVFVEHIEQKERYSLAVIPKTDEQKSLIEEALSENILFADLGDEELTLMVATMKSKQIAKGEQLITQGEMGDNFYIVEEGAFEFRVDGKAVGSAKAKASFGELALLYNAPRAATVACVSDGATVWTLPRANFRKIVSSAASRSVGETHRALKSVPLLSELTDSQIEKIVDSVTTVRFEAGDTIIRKGDEGRVFYFIKSGEVNCTKIGSGDDNADLQLGPGEYFGERALMTSEPRAANVIALTDLECIALDKDDFEAHLGPLMERLDRNLGARVLQSLPIFAELSDVERMRLVEDFEEEKFKDGEHIVRQGEPGSRFYIVREGEALVSKKVADEHVHIATLHNGDFFGEGALLKDEPRGADVRAHGDVRVFSLERAAFDRSMQKVKGHLSHHLSMRMDKTDDAVKSKKKQLYENIQMNELDIMRTLGTGTFGRVKLVHHPKLKKAFALKQLQKAAVCAYRQQTNVMSEKNIMELADHPFILRLHKTFKDRDCLYMLLEFVQGGELFTLLHIRGGKLSDKDARFYAGCVQDALEYLHDRDIVYRDLKPENLLIDEEGYIRVVDFGFSKKITTRSFTLCGTPEYLAPELVLGKGHGKPVDIWALGVLIFEMIAGSSPFADPINSDHMIICKKIVRNKVEFPRRFGEKAKDLVSKLLVREPGQRIGCLAGGHLDLKEHPWFNSLNFNDLVRKRIKAPWVPEIKDYLDTSAFEAFDEDDNIEPFFQDSTWADAF